MDPFATLQLVGKRDLLPGLVDEGDVEIRGFEHLEQPFAYEFDDLVKVELFGQSRADLVDDRELTCPLLGLSEEVLGLIEQPRVLQGHAQVRCDGREQPFIRVGERVLRQSSESDHAQDAVDCDHGHTQPGLSHLTLDADPSCPERGRLFIGARPKRPLGLDHDLRQSAKRRWLQS